MSRPEPVGRLERKRRNRREAQDAPDAYELFNLARDVPETKDLAAEEPERVKQLRERLDAFAREAVPPF